MLQRKWKWATGPSAEPSHQLRDGDDNLGELDKITDITTSCQPIPPSFLCTLSLIAIVCLLASCASLPASGPLKSSAMASPPSLLSFTGDYLLQEVFQAWRHGLPAAAACGSSSATPVHSQEGTATGRCSLVVPFEVQLRKLTELRLREPSLFLALQQVGRALKKACWTGDVDALHELLQELHGEEVLQAHLLEGYRAALQQGWLHITELLQRDGFDIMQLCTAASEAGEASSTASDLLFTVSAAQLLEDQEEEEEEESDRDDEMDEEGARAHTFRRACLRGQRRQLLVSLRQALSKALRLCGGLLQKTTGSDEGSGAAAGEQVHLAVGPAPRGTPAASPKEGAGGAAISSTGLTCSRDLFAAIFSQELLASALLPLWLQEQQLQEALLTPAAPAAPASSSFHASQHATSPSEMPTTSLPDPVALLQEWLPATEPGSKRSLFLLELQGGGGGEDVSLLPCPPPASPAFSLLYTELSRRYCCLLKQVYSASSSAGWDASAAAAAAAQSALKVLPFPAAAGGLPSSLPSTSLLLSASSRGLWHFIAAWLRFWQKSSKPASGPFYNCSLGEGYSKNPLVMYQRSSLDGETAMHMLAREGCWERLAALILLGADVNALSPEGMTPLHALLEGCKERLGLGTGEMPGRGRSHGGAAAAAVVSSSASRLDLLQEQLLTILSTPAPTPAVAAAAAAGASSNKPLRGKAAYFQQAAADAEALAVASHAERQGLAMCYLACLSLLTAAGARLSWQDVLKAIEEEQEQREGQKRQREREMESAATLAESKSESQRVEAVVGTRGPVSREARGSGSSSSSGSSAASSISNSGAVTAAYGSTGVPKQTAVLASTSTGGAAEDSGEEDEEVEEQEEEEETVSLPVGEGAEERKEGETASLSSYKRSPHTSSSSSSSQSVSLSLAAAFGHITAALAPISAPAAATSAHAASALSLEDLIGSFVASVSLEQLQQQQQQQSPSAYTTVAVGTADVALQDSPAQQLWRSLLARGVVVSSSLSTAALTVEEEQFEGGADSREERGTVEKGYAADGVGTLSALPSFAASAPAQALGTAKPQPSLLPAQRKLSSYSSSHAAAGKSLQEKSKSASAASAAAAAPEAHSSAPITASESPVPAAATAAAASQAVAPPLSCLPQSQPRPLPDRVMPWRLHMAQVLAEEAQAQQKEGCREEAAGAGK